MREIEFIATYGDEKKKVVIGQDVGAGDSWRVLVDNYNYGVLFYRDGKWWYFDHLLETEDVMIITDMIEKYLADKEAGKG